MFLEMRFDLGTLDSGEGLLPFGLLVNVPREIVLHPLTSLIIVFGEVHAVSFNDCLVYSHYVYLFLQKFLYLLQSV